MSSGDHSAAELLLLTVGAKQASLPFGRLQAKAAMPQADVESEERIQERMDAIPREMAKRRRLEKEARRERGAFCPLGPAELGAGVSHEIRNPLGPIFLHVNLLAEELSRTAQRA
jgi:signal transduction histidine kinase